MEALLTSILVVALAEIGDKTQLLAIVLATRFRHPLPIIAGILVATLANHIGAAWLGSAAASVIQGPWFRYLIAISFVAMAGWALIPDRLEENEAEGSQRFGAFLTTTVAFFLVEMGDKTQLATVALGAQFGDVAAVAVGTTLGMMIANVPAVLAGDALTRRVPLGAIRIITATLFLAMGLWLFVQTAMMS